MVKLTKAQLTAENAALRNELNSLRVVNAEHQALLARAREVIAAARPSPNMIATHNQPAWQLERQAKMQAAKAEAMESGRLVKVS